MPLIRYWQTQNFTINSINSSPITPSRKSPVSDHDDDFVHFIFAFAFESSWIKFQY
jgi:hypothetical protein